jgi:hypothetical protein
MQQALGLTSNRVHHWRLIIEEYGPEIIYIKGEHNTVADTISWLDFSPKAETKNLDQNNWKILAKRWCAFSTHPIKGNSINSTMDSNHVFVIRSVKE